MYLLKRTEKEVQGTKIHGVSPTDIQEDNPDPDTLDPDIRHLDIMMMIFN
jgi:hypothetical protein